VAAVEIAADQEIRFARAAVPGAVADAAKADVAVHKIHASSACGREMPAGGESEGAM
jgi:hypothetical protein